MILSKDLDLTLKCLEGIVNSAVHPQIAVRAVMVDLKPIRREIVRLKQVMMHCSGAEYPREGSPKEHVHRLVDGPIGGGWCPDCGMVWDIDEQMFVKPVLDTEGT